MKHRIASLLTIFTCASMSPIASANSIDTYKININEQEQSMHVFEITDKHAVSINFIEDAIKKHGLSQSLIKQSLNKLNDTKYSPAKIQNSFNNSGNIPYLCAYSFIKPEQEFSDTAITKIFNESYSDPKNPLREHSSLDYYLHLEFHRYAYVAKCFGAGDDYTAGTVATMQMLHKYGKNHETQILDFLNTYKYEVDAFGADMDYSIDKGINLHQKYDATKASKSFIWSGSKDLDKISKLN